jgi:hypothetical protein
VRERRVYVRAFGGLGHNAAERQASFGELRTSEVQLWGRPRRRNS